MRVWSGYGLFVANYIDLLDTKDLRNFVVRKIIQVSSMAAKGCITIHTLCNDGSLWRLTPLDQDWIRVKDIPQDHFNPEVRMKPENLMEFKED